MKDFKRKVLNNDRRDYSRISGSLELPYLCEIQTSSFEWFKNEGINEVFREYFPMTNFAGTVSLNFDGAYFGETKYDPFKCKNSNLTYSAPLYAKLSLHFEDGTIQEKSNDIFMGDFPMMTEAGTFIINGSERVIVSQIVRSPGAYVSKTMDKSGKYLYGADIIPARGTWLEFESDIKDQLSVRIDKQRKVSSVVLLRALGLCEDLDILNLFGPSKYLKDALEKLQLQMLKGI